MAQRSDLSGEAYLRRNVMLIAILAVAGTIAGFVLSSGVTVDAQPSMLRRPTGSPQLISSEPLPQMGELQDGQMCQWEPASASSSLVAALRHPRQAARASGQTSRAEAAAKDPVRVIRDPYAAYSSVAVDPVRNEVVMTDENLFNIMVYDRLANTPPNGTVKLTEPSRDSPQNDRSPQSLNRRTSPLSNRKKPGPGGVDDERP